MDTMTEQKEQLQWSVPCILLLGERQDQEVQEVGGLDPGCRQQDDIFQDDLEPLHIKETEEILVLQMISVSRNEGRDEAPSGNFTITLTLWLE